MDEINPETAVWTRPATRMKGAFGHHVPLSVQALEILDRVRILGRPGRLIFALPTRPLIGHDFRHVLRPLGYRDRKRKPITMHGFRTTFRTWAAYVAQAQCEVAEAALSHLADPTVRAYLREEGDEGIEVRRGVMQLWADYVVPRAGGR